MALLPNLDDSLQWQRWGTSLDVTGNMLGAWGHIAYARQARQAAAFEAAQLEQDAGQAQAASQFQAANVDERTKLITSRALAVAAASGGGASDPGVVSQIAKIAQEGAYRRSLAIYQGDEAARKMNMQADTARYRGAAVSAAETRSALGSMIQAGSAGAKGLAKQRQLEANNGETKRIPTVLGNYPGSMRQKYGGDGPTAVTPDSPAPRSMWDIDEGI